MTLKESLKESIARDRARQIAGILTPWRAEALKTKTPHEYYATVLLKDGKHGTITAYRQRDILEVYGKDAVLVLECLCTF
jgi:hypothetical protein